MKFIYYSIFFLMLSSLAIGQEINVDAVMADAKREVEKGNYDKALLILEPVSAKFPENDEITIYKGRIYSWKKEYKSAIAILAPLADKTPPVQDAVLAIINVYFWSE